MNKRHSGMDFTEGNVTRLLIAFMLPFLLANILNSVYNTVDMIVIGKCVGSAGTVAVSQGGKIIQLLTQAAVSFATGGQVLISQELGAKKDKEIPSTIGTMFSSVMLLSLVIGIVCFVFTGDIISLLHVPEESFTQACMYMRITLLGFPMVCGYNVICCVLRSFGDSRNPLVFIAISATVNLVLDIILVKYVGMGVAGAAIATVFSQILAFGVSLLKLYAGRSEFGFEFTWRNFRVHADKLSIITRIGLPMALHSICIQGTQLLIIGFVNGFGLMPATAYSIGDKILTLTNVVQVSVNQASGTIVAQNIGAAKYDRVKKLLRSSLVITLSIAALLSLVSVLAPETVFGLFSDERAVLDYSRVFMLISVSTYFLSSLCGTFGGIVTGSGNGRLQMIVGILDGVVLRTGFSFLFAYALDMGVAGFFLGNSLARLSPVCINSIYYLSGRWKRRKRPIDYLADEKEEANHDRSDHRPAAC